MQSAQKRLRRRSKSRAGFTIIELLVVIAILGIVAAISLFAYRQLRPRLQLTNTAREVMSFIHRARLSAIRSHNTVTIALETELGADVTPYNPTGIRAERLILSRVDVFGAREEISSYQLPKSYPPIYVWGDEEVTVNGESSISFDGDVLTINSDGTVSEIGAFRFSYPTDGIRNILEVAVLTQSGSPQIRKFLNPADRPSALTGQDYFVETTAGNGRPNIWVWY